MVQSVFDYINIYFKNLENAFKSHDIRIRTKSFRIHNTGPEHHSG
jgi:hypothetical protein